MITRRHFLAQTATGLAGLAWLARAAEETAPAIELGVSQSFEKSGLIKAAGFQYLEESVARVLVPKAGEEEFEKVRAAITAASLPVRACAGFFPAEMKLVGPQVDLDALSQYVATACRRAQALGITRLVLGSGKARQIPDGFPRDKAQAQFVEFGKRIAPLAQPHGVIVVLEPLQKSECNFINRVDEGLLLVEAVGHPNFQQHADIFHMLREDEGPESLLKAGARLQHCHVATKKNRRAPGIEDEDFRPYFKALKAIGYRGRISIESGWKDLAAELPTAFRTLRAQLDSA